MKARIESTIRFLCTEVDAAAGGRSDWKDLPEQELLYEACVCILGSQMIYEVAEATCERLRNLGLLEPSALSVPIHEYQRRLAQELSLPVQVDLSGETKHVRPRFRNRFATLLTSMLDSLYGQDTSLRKLLSLALCPKNARQTLVKYICGFGPKQASLFLRRVGYTTDLAVLDTHVLDYMRIVRGIHVDRRRVSRLMHYEQTEQEFIRIAHEFGYPTGCVDLAVWITMRVAKREAFQWH